MYFGLWTHFWWLVFFMAIPFVSGLISSLVTKHKPPVSCNVNVGLFTVLFSMILGMFFYTIIGIWILIANLLLFVLFSFWWKTDESKKWFTWGVYILINLALDLAVFGLIWGIQRGIQ